MLPQKDPMSNCHICWLPCYINGYAVNINLLFAMTITTCYHNMGTLFFFFFLLFSVQVHLLCYL